MKYLFTISARLVLLLVLTASSFAAQSQITYSPYSRFGLGSLYPQGEVVNHSMGGVSTPLANPWVINNQNPATYSFLVGPTFQFSGRVSNVTLRSSENSQNVTTGSLNHISFGFPLKNDWGLAFGIVPFSSTSYNISISDNHPEAGDFNRTYNGDGGLNKAYLGLSKGFNIERDEITRDSLGNPVDTITTVPHRIHFGANLNYIIGTLQNSQQIIFDDPNYFNSRTSSSTSLRGAGSNVGVFYSTNIYKKFKGNRRVKNLTLQVGANYNIETRLSSEVEALSQTYRDNNGIQIPGDTAFFSSTDAGKLTLPQKINAGIALKYTVRKREFLLALDYEQQDWSTLENDVSSIDNAIFSDARQLSVGFQYTPNDNFTDFNLAFHEIGSYRLGFRMTDTYLSLSGEPISEMALSTGLSFPIKTSRSMSKFHLGMEIGKRGRTDNALIEEQFVQAYIGFTLNPDFRNRWFRQRKYR